jgi:hypothetical protein
LEVDNSEIERLSDIIAVLEARLVSCEADTKFYATAWSFAELLNKELRNDKKTMATEFNNLNSHKVCTSDEHVVQFCLPSTGVKEKLHKIGYPACPPIECQWRDLIKKMDVFPVRVQKRSGRLGFRIVLWSLDDDKYMDMAGICIGSLTRNGAAQQSLLQLDDLIMAVNGISLVGVKPAYGKSILKETGEEVLLLIGRVQSPRGIPEST